MLPTILLTVLLGQSASTIAGAAMGPNNQPVGQALIFVSQGAADDGSVPALGQGVTDEEGRYRLEVGRRAPTRALPNQQPMVFAYRPGMALSGSALGPVGAERDSRALQLSLEPAAKRTLKLADSAGRPLANVRVLPLQVSPGGRSSLRMRIPDALGERLAVTTDANGQAALGYLSAKYELQVIRVTLGASVTHVVEVPQALYLADPLSFVLDPGGGLSGRVLTEDGKPAAGAEVVVWPNLRRSTFGMWNVGFAGGPLRAGDDGSFRTPPGLLQGQEYRVLVKANDWEQKNPTVVTLSKDPSATTRYPDIVLTPKRALAGRVVDRQSHAVADAEIIAGSFGSSSKARSQSQGQFRVSGLGPGRGAVLVVRAEGFATYGRALGEHESKDLEVVLTRIGENPVPVLTTRPDPLPEAERRKLARQVLQPYLDKAFAEGNDTDKSWALRALTAIDPEAAIELLDKTTFASQNDRQQGFLRIQVVQLLAGVEPDRAAEIARAIKDPYPRASSLLELARLLAAERNDRKKELIGKAILAARQVAKADEQMFVLAWAAALFMDCGDKEQSKSLAAEVRESLEKAANPAGSMFTVGALVRLGRVDLPAAQAILENKVAEADRPLIMGNIATQLAASDPAEAERLLDFVKTQPFRFNMAMRTCYRMAPVDLPRARKIALAQTDGRRRATALVCVASALPPSQRTLASDLAKQALAELKSAEGEQEGQELALQPLLPKLEAIDPALVSELFWHILAQPSNQIRDLVGLARYEPDVAAVWHPTDTITKSLAQSAGSPGASTLISYLLPELAARDPKRAVGFALKDGDPPLSGLRDAIVSRMGLIEFLGRPDATRWKYRMSPYSWNEETIHGDEDIRN